MGGVGDVVKVTLKVLFSFDSSCRFCHYFTIVTPVIIGNGPILTDRDFDN